LSDKYIGYLLKELDYLINEFREQISTQVQFLSTGRPANMEEYRQVVGAIRGLESAIQITKDLVQRLENSDES
jgi:hypothetical protein